MLFTTLFSVILNRFLFQEEKEKLDNKLELKTMSDKITDVVKKEINEKPICDDKKSFLAAQRYKTLANILDETNYKQYLKVSYK